MTDDPVEELVQHMREVLARESQASVDSKVDYRLLERICARKLPEAQALRDELEDFVFELGASLDRDWFPRVYSSILSTYPAHKRVIRQALRRAGVPEGELPEPAALLALDRLADSLPEPREGIAAYIRAASSALIMRTMRDEFLDVQIKYADELRFRSALEYFR